MASRRYQWANSSEELLKQISSLSTYNRQHVPSDVYEQFFETVVCIPFENGAGVLEMGTKALVPENESMLQMLGSIEGLALGSYIKREERILSSALNTPASYPAGQYCIDQQGLEHPEERNDTLRQAMMAQMYGGRAIRQSSISSSYCSSSSAASSPPSADYQMGSSSNTGGTSTMLSSSQFPSLSDDQDMSISNPATSFQATSFTRASASILNQLGHILLHAGSTTPAAFGDPQLNTNADQYGAASHASHDHFHSSGPALYSSTITVAASPHLSSPSQHQTHYNQQHFRWNDWRGGNQQQQQRVSHKMIDSLCSESMQEASTEFLNKFSTSTAPAEGNDKQAAATSGLEAHDSSSRYIDRGINIEVLNASEGFQEARHAHQKIHDQGGELVGLSTAISKPTAEWTLWECAGSQAKEEHVYTPGNTQQGEGKDHYINRQLAASAKDLYCRNKAQQSTAATTAYPATPRDHYINMQQDLDSGSDQNIKIQQYAASSTKSAAGTTSTRYGAFKRWNRSLHEASHQASKQKSAAKDSFLKKLLVHYLFTQYGESSLWIDQAIRRGGQSGPLIEYVQNVRRTESTQNELAAIHHKFAERDRRRKQAECYNALRTLVPNIPKKDKVALLERSIEYLKELKKRVVELEQENATLIHTYNEDNKDAMRNPSHGTSSQMIASCLHLPPSIFEDGNYFQLNVNKVMKCEETNMINIEILSSLQKKNLHCIKFRSEFEKSTRKVDVQVLAKYKEGDNCTLSLDGILEIEDWWPRFMKNLESENP